MLSDGSDVDPLIGNDVWQVLSGLAKITGGGEVLRTHGGDAHGREKGIAPVHARSVSSLVHMASIPALFVGSGLIKWLAPPLAACSRPPRLRRDDEKSLLADRRTDRATSAIFLEVRYSQIVGQDLVEIKLLVAPADRVVC